LPALQNVPQSVPMVAAAHLLAVNLQQAEAHLAAQLARAS
jgi:hypothetical protein